jgi:hypothetical protein
MIDSLNELNSSNRDDDFPSVVSFSDIAECFGNFVQRVASIDDWGHFSGSKHHARANFG